MQLPACNICRSAFRSSRARTLSRASGSLPRSLGNPPVSAFDPSEPIRTEPPMSSFDLSERSKSHSHLPPCFTNHTYLLQISLSCSLGNPLMSSFDPSKPTRTYPSTHPPISAFCRTFQGSFTPPTMLQKPNFFVANSFSSLVWRPAF